MKTLTFLLSAGALVASTALASLPASACETFVSAEAHGWYNASEIAVRHCGQVGIYQDGYDNHACYDTPSRLL